MRGTRVVAAWLMLVACDGIPEIHAEGVVGGHDLRSTVDHEVAADYVAGRTLPEELEALRAYYVDHGHALSQDRLRAVAHAYSVDVATLLFLEAVGAREDAQEMTRTFAAEVDELRRHGFDMADGMERWQVLLVPGWYFQTTGGDNGADLQAQIDVLQGAGIRARRVPIHENGTVEDNARIVADAVRSTQPDDRVLLVSTSKGGTDVAVALGQELSASESRRVQVWISLGGAVRGTPLVDRFLAPDLFLFTHHYLHADGYDMASMRSMRAGPSRRRFDALSLPAHVRVLCVVPVPLSGQVGDRAWPSYRLLRPHGPNDGITLLADELVPGSVPLLVPGVDHYIRHPDLDLWTLALFRWAHHE